MVARVVEGIDLFKIAGRSISGDEELQDGTTSPSYPCLVTLRRLVGQDERAVQAYPADNVARKSNTRRLNTSGCSILGK